MRIQRAQPPSDSGVKRSVILWRNPLASGFFAQFDSFQIVVAPQQLIALSGAVLRCVVQHADWHEHGQGVRKRAAQNELESRAADADANVLGALPRISL